MDVFIGKYTSRWISNIHSDYMNKKYGWVDWPAKKDYTKYEKFLERAEDVLQSIYNATVNQYLDRKKRLVKVKIHNYDTWGMDHTLALIILPMLKQLKETKHGSPSVDDKDVPKELRSTSAPPKENEYDIDGNHHARWDWVLDEMIFAFESIVDDEWENQFHTGVHDHVFTPIDKEGNVVSKDEATLYRWDKGPNDTSHFDKKGYVAYNKRIQKGLELFGKYYRGLWD